MTRFSPTLAGVGAWLHKYDLASKLEGWLITNDSDNICTIATLDDPSSMAATPGWPPDFIRPKFSSDQGAIEFVRGRAADGSEWHTQAVAIHESVIPMSVWIPDPRPHEKILEHCSAGPWRHGLRVLPFSADSQPCVYGDERELHLALLDETDEEATCNVVLMAAAWELCRQLGTLLEAALAAELKQPLDTNAIAFGSECDSTFELLSRIRRDMQKSATERYGEEETHE